MQTLNNTTINEELIIVSNVEITGEVIVNKNIIIKPGGLLTITSATLYFDEDCGILVEGTLEAINTTFDSKRLKWGEIIFREMSSSHSLMKNCTITNSTGISIEETTSLITIDGCNISECGSELRGGISSHGTNITIRNCTISDCKGALGGGLFIVDSTKVEKCKIENCSARKGAGVYMMSYLSSHDNAPSLYKCTINNCKSEEYGGGIFAGNGAQIDDCKISNCYAGYKGGGIHVEYGGNIRETTLENCLITDCTAGRQGGGIASSLNTKDRVYLKSLVVRNCKAKDGGGIDIDSKGKVYFKDIEIVDCKAEDGGGMLVGCGAEVISSTPTKIISCESDDFNSSNALLLKPNDGQAQVDNFELINCIDAVHTEDVYKYLICAFNEGYEGSADVTNCRAYNVTKDGDIQECDIKKFSHSRSYTWLSVNDERIG